MIASLHAVRMDRAIPVGLHAGNADGRRRQRVVAACRDRETEEVVGHWRNHPYESLPPCHRGYRQPELRSPAETAGVCALVQQPVDIRQRFSAVVQVKRPAIRQFRLGRALNTRG